MSVLDHWHPAFLSSKLKKQPQKAIVCGKEVVLFRNSEGKAACLENQCAHRRMRLNYGKVIGDRIQCPYHGWTFDACGKGESPGTPKLHACAPSFEVSESNGLVWVRRENAQSVFPPMPQEPWFQLGTLEHVAPAPLDTTMDNFCEIEHTGTTHAIFGYQLDRMHEVDVKFEWTDDSVTVRNHGPAKPLPWWANLLLRVRKGMLFFDHWTTYFSPCYSIYDHWFEDPDSGKQAWVAWKIYIFFTPIDAENTRVTSLVFGKSDWWFLGKDGGLLTAKSLLTSRISHEIDLDVAILGKLADKSPGIEGMKLSRFDRVLGLNRERVSKVYYQQSKPTLSTLDRIRPLSA